MDIGRQISFFRTKMGLTQQALAHQAGISLATLQNIEANRANPAILTLEKILGQLRLRINIQPLPAELNKLISLGLPLMAEGPLCKKDPKASAKKLHNELLKVSTQTNSLNERESLALSAFLLAIRDHYPSQWNAVPRSLKTWVQRQSTEKVLKLRRISLSYLSEYL